MSWFSDDLRERALDLGQAEQREVLGDAPAAGEARVEGVDLPGRVAGRGRQEEDARTLCADASDRT